MPPIYLFRRLSMNRSLIRQSLTDAMKRMFIRGGENDKLVSFVVGQVYLILISVIVSTFAVTAIFRGGVNPNLRFLEILGQTGAMGFLALMIWVHEMTHLALFRRYGVPVFGLVLPPIGGVMVTAKTLPPYEFLMVALAGPLSGFVALPLIVLGLIALQPMWVFMGVIWVIINLMNLLPVYPLDGGVVLKSLLSHWFSPKIASRIVWAVTLLIVLGFLIVLPDPRVLILQIVIVVMMGLVDHGVGRLFSWFKVTDEVPVSTTMTRAQFFTGLASYFGLVQNLVLILWLGLLYLPGISLR